MIDQKYRIRSNKKLDKRFKQGGYIVVVWADSKPTFMTPGIRSWVATDANGYSLDATCHEIYKVQ